MIKYFKILSEIIKSSLRLKVRGILNGRYFEGVEFLNKNNIIVNENSFIEKGSRLWATDPISVEINICIEEKCWIGRDVEIQTNYGSKIILKKNVSIQDRCKILGSVYIGQDSLIAPDVFLSSGNHYYNYKPELPIKRQDKLVIRSPEDFKIKNNPIVIEEDCWIGKNSVIVKGVYVGRGAIIGANTFVNTNIPPFEIWGGSPAKFIKKRLEFIPPLNIQSDRLEHRAYFYRGFDHICADEDGFFSSNSSLCVLAVSDRISLFLSAKIYAEGTLKIWGNEYLIFSDNVAPGCFNETLSLKKSLNDKIVSELYQGLSNDTKRFLCIVFEFKPKEEHKINGFSINKIEQND